MLTINCWSIAILNAAIARLDPFQADDLPSFGSQDDLCDAYSGFSHYESGEYPTCKVVPVHSAITGETFNVMWID